MCVTHFALRFMFLEMIFPRKEKGFKSLVGRQMFRGIIVDWWLFQPTFVFSKYSTMILVIGKNNDIFTLSWYVFLNILQKISVQKKIKNCISFSKTGEHLSVINNFGRGDCPSPPEDQRLVFYITICWRGDDNWKQPNCMQNLEMFLFYPLPLNA